jgi:hypothetical protein
VTTHRRLAISLATLFTLLAIGNVAFRSFAAKHFVPAQKLAAALRAGHDCMVVTGDSRMAAALSVDSLRAPLRAAGVDVCVADLALGGTGLAAQSVEVRAFLGRTTEVPLLVLGAVAEALLPTEEADPAEWTGSNAVILELSETSDASIHFPFEQFPSIRTIDRRERFYVERLSAFGVYRSLIWARVQGLQDRIAGRMLLPRNSFGNLEDMEKLEESFRRQGIAALNARQLSATRPFHPWFAFLRSTARERGIPLVVIELPMPTRYRQEVSESPSGRALRRDLAELLQREESSYVDLSNQEWFNDRLLSDGLHLSDAGAVELSRDLGAALVRHLQKKKSLK